MIEARWYQQEAKQSIYDYFRNNVGNPVIALPTGTGKSLVIAQFIAEVVQTWPSQVIMCLTHRKELIDQNSRQLLKVWPNAPIGIFSAGLKQKQSHMPVTFGGIQSVYKSLEQFDRVVNLLLIDECHLINPNDLGMYAETIKFLKHRNPRLKVIGFTATDYRAKQGRLTDPIYDEDGNLTSVFTDVIYDLTNVEGWTRLIAEGYLCKLVARATSTQIDISNVSITQGEFNLKQLSKVSDNMFVNLQVVDEMIKLGWDRWAWLVFAVDIDHCEHLAAMFQERNFAIEAVHSRLSEKQNTARLDAFKRGELRGLVNNDKLTTGMDHPPIDLIGMVRHTMSPSLWVQMAGRGTRPYDMNNPNQYIKGYDFVKHNCLLLDYAKNCERLGPVNNPNVPRAPGAKGKRGPGDMPVRICSNCGVYNFAAARQCDHCGFEFPVSLNIDNSSDATAVFIDMGEDIIERIPVVHVGYSRYQKNESTTPMLRVVYMTEHPKHRTIIENIMLENPASKKHNQNWWMKRSSMPTPTDINEALKYHRQLKMPRYLTCVTNRKYPEIQSTEF